MKKSKQLLGIFLAANMTIMSVSSVSAKTLTMRKNTAPSKTVVASKKPTAKPTIKPVSKQKDYTVDLISAFAKSMDIKSMESKQTIKMDVSFTGLTNEEKQQMAKFAPYLKNIKIDTTSKANLDKKQLSNDAQVDLTATVMGVPVSTSMWTNQGVKDNVPYQNVVMSIPEAINLIPNIDKTMPLLINKKYFVYDSSKMLEELKKDPEAQKTLQQFDMKQLQQLSSKYTARLQTLLAKTFKDIKLSPNMLKYNGVQKYKDKDNNQQSAKCYELNIGDTDLINLVQNSGNVLFKSADVKSFVKDYFNDIYNTLKGEEKIQAKKEFDTMFKEWDKNSQKISKKFNSFITTMKKSNPFKGTTIKAKYYIDNSGYIVNSTNSMTILINSEKLSNMSSNGKVIPNSSKGIMTFKIDCFSNIYNINKAIVIEVPKTDKDNSIDYMDLMKSAMAMEETK